MKRLREIIPGLLLLVFCLWANMGYAQEDKVLGNGVGNVSDATKAMKKIGALATKEFLKETNNLAIKEKLHCVPSSDKKIWVAALVKNKVPGKPGGDYCNYWESKDKNKKDGQISRYTWVFTPKDFMDVCIDKKIIKDKKVDAKTTTDEKDAKFKRLSKRLCQLLGLSDDVLRDTIVYMKVPANCLFRPAYQLNPSEKLTEVDTQRGTPIYSEPQNVTNEIAKKQQEWMATQQKENNYPWTRMGYTFDWGNNDKWDINHTGYIGVSEFVIMPGTPYSDLGYTTIEKMTEESWGDYNPPTKKKFVSDF